MNLFEMNYHKKPEVFFKGYRLNCRKYEIYIPAYGTYVFSPDEFNQKANELFKTSSIIL